MIRQFFNAMRARKIPDPHTDPMKDLVSDAFARVRRETDNLEATIAGYVNDYRLIREHIADGGFAMGIIPNHWMPQAKMKGLILHWTGGGPAATKLDLEHYHFVINQDSTIVPGVDIRKNEKAGTPGYAQHTKNCNTGFIAVSLAGMLDAQNKIDSEGRQSFLHHSRFPIIESQWRRAVLAAAALCQNYEIPITDKTLLSHAEVQDNLGIKQNKKWDIAILPWQPEDFNTARKCGDLFRAEVEFVIKNGPPQVLK